MTTAPLRLLPSVPRAPRGGPRPSFVAAAAPTITFARFRKAPKVYEASADGAIVEAGVTYDFDVFEDGDVRLWRDDRRIRAAHKLALRATVLAAYRATPAGVLALLSAAVDRAVAGARP